VKPKYEIAMTNSIECCILYTKCLFAWCTEWSGRKWERTLHCFVFALLYLCWCSKQAEDV